MLVVSLPRFLPGPLLGLAVALVVLGLVALALAIAFALGVNVATGTEAVVQGQDVPFRW